MRHWLPRPHTHIAEAAAVLDGPEAHAGAVYELTGREALALSDIARTLVRWGAWRRAA